MRIIAEFKHLFVFILALIMAAAGFSACGGNKDMGVERETDNRDLSAQDYALMNLAGRDAPGRRITPKDNKKAGTRYVGIFYSLWLGQHQYIQSAIFDINKLLSTPEGTSALRSTEDNGLSKMGEFHFCGEPVFGYYNMKDPYVIKRHLKMLTLAGIDYLALDCTNSVIYTDVCNLLFGEIMKLQEQGFNPPRIMFYTNSNSGTTVKKLYNEFFRTEKLDAVWFSPNGKPLIAGITENNEEASDQTRYPASFGASATDFIPEDIRYRFEIVESQWPNGIMNEKSIPWMSWSYPQEIHNDSKAVSVSVAQHSPSRINYSFMDPQSSRGFDYHTGKIEKDWKSGKNFENQWETVFENEDKINNVLVTGWNEWMAIKQADAGFVDVYTSEYSRDIEPDSGVYGDNFYLQLIRNLRNYKYTEAKHYKRQKMKIDMDDRGSLAQWDHVRAAYADMTGDAVKRNYEDAAGRSVYRDDSARNDISLIKAVSDAKNLYFYIKTAENVTAHADGDTGWMNILISVNENKANFNGFNYIVNRHPDGKKTSVERSKGGYNWETAGSAEYRIYDDIMLFSIPLETLGIDPADCTFGFKAADNITDPADIMNYYVTGDSAPIGRLFYMYGY